MSSGRATALELTLDCPIVFDGEFFTPRAGPAGHAARRPPDHLLAGLSAMPDMLRAAIEVGDRRGRFRQRPRKLVDAIRARHETAVAAVLFYGSCLRQRGRSARKRWCSTSTCSSMTTGGSMIGAGRRWRTICCRRTSFRSRSRQAMAGRCGQSTPSSPWRSFCDLVSPRTFPFLFLGAICPADAPGLCAR